MKVSQEKRNQFIFVVLCTVAVLVLMWLNLIRPRYAALSQIATEQRDAGDKLATIQTAIKQAHVIAAELAQKTQALADAENDMASGDLYSWTYNTIRLFKTSYQVDIPDIGHPDVGTMDLLPAFPFKQVKFTVTGTAYYHDLGKFIADFENKFPHMRVVNLQMQPANASGGEEKLSFKMDIIALVKPGSQ
jgi:Type II secretion system (T2SS), protein M subtype b